MMTEVRRETFFFGNLFFRSYEPPTFAKSMYYMRVPHCQMLLRTTHTSNQVVFNVPPREFWEKLHPVPNEFEEI